MAENNNKNATKNQNKKKKKKPQQQQQQQKHLEPEKSESEEVTKNIEAQIKDLPFLNATDSVKRIDYGTNDTCELLERIPSQIVNIKLDEVLTAVKTVDNLCKYERCKAKTNLMGLDCAHCSKRYCFKHGLPEVHGCAEAVKVDERKKFLHPKPAKTIRAEQDLADAKKRLTAKLKDMKVERMQKTGGSAGGGGGGASKKKS